MYQKREQIDQFNAIFIRFYTSVHYREHSVRAENREGSGSQWRLVSEKNVPGRSS